MDRDRFHTLNTQQRYGGERGRLSPNKQAHLQPQWNSL